MQARRYTGPGVIVQGGREIKVMCFYEVMTTGLRRGGFQGSGSPPA
jgi:hypothetical protein